MTLNSNPQGGRQTHLASVHAMPDLTSVLARFQIV